MCRCTPNIKTPWCGKPGCEVPEQPKGALLSIISVLPSEQIREIQDEMKLLKFMKERTPHLIISEKWYKEKEKLEEKYESIETLFGHESSLLKSIIYYLDNYDNSRNN